MPERVKLLKLYRLVLPEVGIYQKKLESKKERKHPFNQERDHEKKKQR